MKKIFFITSALVMAVLLSGCEKAVQENQTIPPVSETQETKPEQLNTYLVSTEDPAKYCDGANMDSDGFRKTITKEMPIGASGENETDVQRVKRVIDLSTTGNCKAALKDLDISVKDGAVIIPPMDAWAGISIAMCSCKPEVEVNLLRIPRIKNVVWDSQGTQMANPASVNCTQKGGRLEMRDNVGGQYGACMFSDGSECEEWAFFRGECMQGDSLKVKSGNPDSQVNTGTFSPDQTKDVVCDDIYQPVCAKVQIQCIKAPCNPIFETIGNKCEAKKRENMILGMTDGKCEKDLNSACKIESDCTLPPEYAMMSRCRMTAKCVANSCVVVCPNY